MGKLLKSIKNFIRGKADQAADKMKDPVRDGKFAIEDSEKKCAEYRKSIGEFSAKIKIQQKTLQSKEEEVKKWTNLATKAAEAKDIDSVKEALTAKNAAQKFVETLTSEIAMNQKILNNTKSQLDAMSNKISKAKNNFDQLSMRQESADLRKKMSGVNIEDDPLSSLDDLEKDVTEAECQAEAFEEMSGANSGSASVEAKYGNGGTVDVDDEVAKLMASVNKENN